METLKKIGNIVLDVLLILVLITSLTVVVMSVTSRQSGVSNVFGYTLLSIKTDSMDPTIKVGDLIIGRVSVSDAEYEVGDVVTFREIVDNTVIFNTHRIVQKLNVNGVNYYATKGDNALGQDDGMLVAGDIIATWNGTRIPGLGGVLNFLSSGVGFFVFLLVPVLLFFLYYLYKFIKNLIAYNRENAVEAVKKATEEASEEQKQKIIAEYLAAQKASGAGADSGSVTDTGNEEK